MALYRWSTKVSWIGNSFNPSNVGTVWQVITKTSNWYDWENPQGTTYTAGSGIDITNNEISNDWVLSFNWNTWNVSWLQLAPNSPLSPKYVWYWTQAQYDALSQYYTDEENDTVYFTI